MDQQQDKPRRFDDVRDFRLEVVENRLEKMETSIQSALDRFTGEIRGLVRDLRAEHAEEMRELKKKVEEFDRELVRIKATAFAYGTVASVVVSAAAWLLNYIRH